MPSPLRTPVQSEARRPLAGLVALCVVPNCSPGIPSPVATSGSRPAEALSSRASRNAASGEPRAAKQLALGAYHSCALLGSGQVACWGENQEGQLGNGSAEPSAIPILVEALEDVAEIHAGYAATCARRTAGTVHCWGANSHGQADPRPAPELSSPPPVAGAYDGIGEPANFAPGNVRRRPTELARLGPIRSFSMGMQHACALDHDGRVTCWGDASRGQMGPEAPVAAFVQQKLGGLPPLVEIDSALAYSCGRTAAGEVWCWGENEHAQLGTPEPSSTPRRVPGVRGAVALALTAGKACARLTSGRWSCWGDSGECADTTSQFPPGLAEGLGEGIDVVRAAGGCFWCALRSNHELDCGPSPPTLRELHLSGVASVAAGNDHACAILESGGIWCWGGNVRGELGRVTSAVRDPEPGPVQWRSAAGKR
ncbi:RCC1 domain-containing protein [Myxococcota bacterium]